MDPVSLLLLAAGGLVMAAASKAKKFASNPLDEMHMTSPFGERKAFVENGVSHAAGFHAGLDLRAKVGTNVYAVDDGVVESLESGSAGNILRLRLDRGERVSYVHLDRFKRALGDRVVAGDLVALSGNTGGVVEHLHIEVKPKGATSSVDPAPFLAL